MCITKDIIQYAGMAVEGDGVEADPGTTDGVRGATDSESDSDLEVPLAVSVNGTVTLDGSPVGGRAAAKDIRNSSVERKISLWVSLKFNGNISSPSPSPRPSNFNVSGGSAPVGRTTNSNPLPPIDSLIVLRGSIARVRFCFTRTSCGVKCPAFRRIDGVGDSPPAPLGMYTELLPSGGSSTNDLRCLWGARGAA